MNDKRSLLSARHAILGTISLVAVLSLALMPDSESPRAKEEPPEVTHDGLHRVQDSKAAIGYIKPDADFGAYNRLLILDCHVAFKKNWQRDKNREATTLSQRVKDSDMERIKEDMANLFLEVFVEELDTKGGYEVVDKIGEDVLIIRPAIIDLDITAPDLGRDTGRSRTFTSSAGAATIYIELYDSVTSEILARAVDRKGARDTGWMTWSNRVSNSAEARRILRRWASLLRERLDEYHDGKAGSAPGP